MTLCYSFCYRLNTYLVSCAYEGHKMEKTSGVKRPTLYAIAAAFAVALALPLALSSGQLQSNGIFDECFGADCQTYSVIAQNQ